MNKHFRSLTTLAVVFLLAATPALAGDMDDVFKTITDGIGGGEGGGLGDGKIAEGLLQALEVGTKNAVGFVSKPDGYLKNLDIKIPLPKEIQQIEQLVRMAGQGDKVDDFLLSMNRAAETAAPLAQQIFIDSIKKMSFSDAKKILKGRDNEATLFFQKTTSDTLRELFKPMVNEAMSKVGVTQKYQELNSALPVGEILGFDLDDYVTDKALDGLFFMVAEEERKIRKDPAARVTDLMKDVFGGK